MVNRKVIWTFVALMGLYFLLRALRSIHILPALLSNYGTDLLFVPAMCLFALFFIHYLKGMQLIPTWMILLQTVLISIYFEWYLPNTCISPPCYVSDYGDVIAYFIGAILFIGFQDKLLVKK